MNEVVKQKRSHVIASLEERLHAKINAGMSAGSVLRETLVAAFNHGYASQGESA